jgi:hypothetical protein
VQINSSELAQRVNQEIAAFADSLKASDSNKVLSLSLSLFIDDKLNAVVQSFTFLLLPRLDLSRVLYAQEAQLAAQLPVGEHTLGDLDHQDRAHAAVERERFV